MEDEPQLIYVEKGSKDLFNNIELFKHEEEGKIKDQFIKKDQFIYAMAVGFKNNKKKKLQKKDWFFRTSNLKKEDRVLIDAVALSYKKDPEILLNKKDVYSIAQEYAKGGIEFLNEQIEYMPFGSFSKKLEQNIFNEISEIITKKQSSKRESAKNTLTKIISQGESNKLEFKSSLRWDLKQKQPNNQLEKVVAKTIVGFLNAEGGTLLIGVKDDGTILGIENDIKIAPKKDRDGFEQRLIQVIEKYIGIEHFDYIKIDYLPSQEKNVCRIKVEPSNQPIYLKDKTKEFYVRIGNTTRPLDIEQANNYTTKHWPKN